MIKEVTMFVVGGRQFPNRADAEQYESVLKITECLRAMLPPEEPQEIGCRYESTARKALLEAINDLGRALDGQNPRTVHFRKKLATRLGV